MRTFIIIFCTIFISVKGLRATAGDSLRPFPKNAVYLEMFGNGAYDYYDLSGYFTLNYARLKSFRYSTIRFSFRSGIGAFKGNLLGEPRHGNRLRVYVPIEASFLFGKRHLFFELGAGYTSVFGSTYLENWMTGYTQHFNYVGIFVFRAGLCYVPKGRFPFIRFGYTPLRPFPPGDFNWPDRINPFTLGFSIGGCF